MPKAAGGSTATKTKIVPTSPEPFPDDTFNDEGWFVTLDDSQDFINACFYGREGSGKTTAAARMANLPGKGKVLFINAEGGLKKIALKKRGVDTANIAVWPDPKRGERMDHKSLDALYRRVKGDLDKDPESWTGVVIDSVTDIYVSILDAVQMKRVNALKNKGADVDEDFVDIADYGTMSKLFRDLMRKFRDLPCHVVFTALERRDVDKDTGKPQYGPAVTPGLQTDLLGYVDFVLMFKAADEDGPFRALSRANSRYRAKDRFDVLPRVVAEPMFDRLVAYLNGDLTEDTDPFQDDLPNKAKAAQDAPAADKDHPNGEEEEKEDETTEVAS